MTLRHKKINGHTFIFHLLLSQYFAINNYQSNKREKLMKAPNYSAAQVAQIIDQYQAGQDIDKIADGHWQVSQISKIKVG